MSRPILIAGPTASGKSALALALAERLGGTVINADALQVYDLWRVLTARPSPEDEARVPHRLYGHVPATVPHSTGRWLREAEAALAEARAAGRVPIFAGGSGLLFAALTQGLADIPETPPEIRAETERRLARDGLPALAEALRARDAETHARLDLANPRRVARAWEALETTGEGLAALHARTPPPLIPLRDARPVRLTPDRAALAARIEMRFDAMLREGALEEARAALALPNAAPQALKPLGAPELTAHLRGETTLAEARDRAVHATRRYAKRQLAWGRNRMAAWPAFADPADALAHLSARE